MQCNSSSFYPACRLAASPLNTSLSVSTTLHKDICPVDRNSSHLIQCTSLGPPRSLVGPWQRTWKDKGTDITSILFRFLDSIDGTVEQSVNTAPNQPLFPYASRWYRHQHLNGCEWVNDDVLKRFEWLDEKKSTKWVQSSVDPPLCRTQNGLAACRLCHQSQKECAAPCEVTAAWPRPLHAASSPSTSKRLSRKYNNSFLTFSS